MRVCVCLDHTHAVSGIVLIFLLPFHAWLDSRPTDTTRRVVGRVGECWRGRGCIEASADQSNTSNWIEVTVRDRAEEQSVRPCPLVRWSKQAEEKWWWGDVEKGWGEGESGEWKWGIDLKFNRFETDRPEHKASEQAMEKRKKKRDGERFANEPMKWSR